MKFILKYHQNLILLLGLENDKIDYIRVVRKDSNLDTVYVGKVLSVAKSLDACFVEVAPKCNVFLRKTECLGGELPKCGDLVVVQIITEALKTKDAAASMHLKLSGSYLILSIPKKKQPQFSISKKITLKKKRKQLQNIINNCISADFPLDVMVRTNAADADEQAIAAEYAELSAGLKELLETGKYRTAFTVLSAERPWYINVIDTVSQTSVEAIITDEPVLYDILKEQLPKYESVIRFYNDDKLTMDQLFGLKTKFDELIQKQVYLKSGGTLVIEQTEALNVIDVNTGKATVNKSNSSLVHKINMEAAAEAARQIKLRNLSGIIIIDFINDTPEGEKEFIKILEEEFAKDRLRPMFIDITKLGLVEITRRKELPSLKELL